VLIMATGNLEKCMWKKWNIIISERSAGTFFIQVNEVATVKLFEIVEAFFMENERKNYP